MNINIEEGRPAESEGCQDDDDCCVKKGRLTFIIESIDSIDGGTLMVTSKEEKVFGILNFVGEKETNCFQGLFTTINVVTKE